jgi:hypothetical protein
MAIVAAKVVANNGQEAIRVVIDVAVLVGRSSEFARAVALVSHFRLPFEDGAAANMARG